MKMLQVALFISLFLQASQGAAEGPRLFMQYLMPSYAATATHSQPSPGTPQAQAQQSAAAAESPSTFSQIFMGLLSFKLQWLNQLATQFISPQHQARPPGYPWMTTVMTTMSGHSPTVPGITISGAPINHHSPYPGAPWFRPPIPSTAKPTPPQDDHWAPPPPTSSPRPTNSSAPITTKAPDHPPHPDHDDIDFESPIQSPVPIVSNNVTVANSTAVVVSNSTNPQ